MGSAVTVAVGVTWRVAVVVGVAWMMVGVAWMVVGVAWVVTGVAWVASGGGGSASLLRALGTWMVCMLVGAVPDFICLRPFARRWVVGVGVSGIIVE